ncbi:MAG TPA: PrsW family glutamic-type intramembrane protease [Candidatus Nanoarchaeia archaeon]|nr:PrsW family glutamic-type intramembrane protease [Candidatus Nanoarchaeia archaeon]
MSLDVLLHVFLGGLLPAILWLWFWLKEDSAHPEPRSLIVVTFIAGVFSVVLTLPIQKLAFNLFDPSTTFFVFILALIEEVMKFLAAYIIAFRSKAFDEPIDAVIFMVTAALGFTALENALFMFGTLIQTGNILETVATGNLRFIGASLLHTMASAVVGLCMALSFYKTKQERTFMLIVGIFIATLLHTLFNLSIISESSSNILATFLVLWLSVIGLLLFFEKIKRLNQINTI